MNTEVSTLNQKEPHISVLLHELVDAISIQKNNKNIIVDATLGMA
jgi:16S rRNA C1402 N4-methylase RsmH